jgi:hypothetical protein
MNKPVFIPKKIATMTKEAEIVSALAAQGLNTQAIIKASGLYKDIVRAVAYHFNIVLPKHIAPERKQKESEFLERLTSFHFHATLLLGA